MPLCSLVAHNGTMDVRIPVQRSAKAGEHFAVLLHLDDPAEQRVHRIWDALDDHGTRPVRWSHGPEYRPHVTLAIARAFDLEHVETVLDPVLSRARGLAVDLTAVGFFVSDKAPAFLAVSPTVDLVTLHRDVHAALDAEPAQVHGNWDYYRPGTWLPHCTLAMDADTPGTVTSAVGSVDDLPIRATVSAVRLEPVPAQLLRPGHSRGGEPQHRAGPQHRRLRRRFLVGDQR
ncbi:2'-5' RNA ligase family protein [Nocardioides sp. Soil796]|uniref:2'-5' RNA ligase family protein n=1 Tax=Nocardioides sp. Soil796 TaxID=1736412 RepID=UPI000B292B4D|nr:2'-5' RNA ligase family protein [Nocardioides sp. Soil796]